MFIMSTVGIPVSQGLLLASGWSNKGYWRTDSLNVSKLKGYVNMAFQPFPNLKNNIQTKAIEMAQQLGAVAAFPKDLSSIPSTHTSFTIVC